MRLHQRKLHQLIALAFSSVSATAVMATSNIQGGGSSLVAPEIGAIGNAATEIGLFGTAEGHLRTTRSALVPDRTRF